MRLLERLRRGQDHVRVAGRLVHVDVDRDHEVEALDRALEPAAVRGREQRVAGHRDERAHLALAGGLDLLGEHGHGQLAVQLRQPAHAAVPAAEASRGAPAPPQEEFFWPAAARVNIAPPSRSRLPVSTFSTSTSQLACVPNSCVQVPIRAYTAPRSAAASSRAMRRISPASIPHAPATASGVKSRTSVRTSSRPFRCSAERAGLVEALLDDRAGHRGEQQRVGAGLDEVVLVRLLGGAGAARVHHHDLAAALADAAQPPAHVGRGEQAAVRDQRVRAQHQQVVAAVDVRDRDRQHRAEHQARPTPASASGRRSTPSRCSASRARAATPARGSARTGCGRSGCRGTRPRRSSRARRSAARAGGRSPRTPRPSSPRPARRRGGPAAWSAGPGPRGAA